MATYTIADPMVNTDSATGTPMRGGEVMDQHMLIYLDPTDNNRAKRANCLQTNNRVRIDQGGSHNWNGSLGCPAEPL